MERKSAKAPLLQKNFWKAVDPSYDDKANEFNAEKKTRNMKALPFLFLIVDNHYLEDIGDCKLAKRAWKSLEEMHTHYEILHQMMLLKGLVNFTMVESMTMDYISKIQNMHRRLANCGIKFKNKCAALYFTFLFRPLSKIFLFCASSYRLTWCLFCIVRWLSSSLVAFRYAADNKQVVQR